MIFETEELQRMTENEREKLIERLIEFTIIR